MGNTGELALLQETKRMCTMTLEASSLLNCKHVCIAFLVLATDAGPVHAQAATQLATW